MHEHWDRVYGGAASDELGWYEPEPSTLALVVSNSTPADSVIDVGGGDSRLVEALLALGYGDLAVMDLSAVALQRARDRLGRRAEQVSWLHADVTRFEPDRQWDLWHDRALFHFLVDEAERDAYLDAARRAIVPGGLLVIATFGPEAPERCAGLPVCRYSPDSLVATFASGFDTVEVRGLAPGRAGDQRPYVAAVLRRRDEP